MLTKPSPSLRGAFRLAADHAPCGIAYVSGEGWSAYDLALGCEGAEPEFVYVSQGVLPIALTDTARAALVSLLLAIAMGTH